MKLLKKGKTLARNEDFFKGEDDMLTSGTLAKCAIMTLDRTLEDSSLVTEKFAKKMSSNITMEKTITFKPNTNIINIAKIGSHVKAGDPLIVFEELEDKTFNDIFGSITDESEKKEISLLTKKYCYFKV